MHDFIPNRELCKGFNPRYSVVRGLEKWEQCRVFSVLTIPLAEAVLSAMGMEI